MSTQDQQGGLKVFHAALREMAQSLGQRRFWGLMSTAVVLLAIAGPFATIEALSLGARLMYWGCIGLASWVLMRFAMKIGFCLVPPHWPTIPVAGMIGVVGVLPVTAIVAAAGIGVGLGLPPGGFWALVPSVAPGVVGISMIVAALTDDTMQGVAQRIAGPPRDSGRAIADSAAEIPAQAGLFARLPDDLGADIVTIQAQDHYIEVATPLGSTRVLMRLGDAMLELGHLRGKQVHRSWWVNLDHVSRMRQSASGRVELVMSTGTIVPVPRARAGELRAALANRD